MVIEFGLVFSFGVVACTMYGSLRAFISGKPRHRNEIWYGIQMVYLVKPRGRNVVLYFGRYWYRVMMSMSRKL